MTEDSDTEVRQSTSDDLRPYSHRRPPRCDRCCAEIWSTKSQLYVKDGIDTYCRNCWHTRTGDDLAEVAGVLE